MHENHEAFTGYIGMDIETYLNSSGMESVRTWGTDVEILCPATVLQIAIYVYTVTGGSRSWIPHKPYFTSSSTDSNVMSQAAYLSNMCAHYERAVRVKWPHCQKSGLGSNWFTHNRLTCKLIPSYTPLHPSLFRSLSAELRMDSLEKGWNWVPKAQDPTTEGWRPLWGVEACSPGKIFEYNP